MAEICEDVVIVGGGIAGLATALALKRVGIKALVLERADELRSTGTALSLLPNAWRALEALAVDHKLLPLYPPSLMGTFTDVATGATIPVSLEHTLDRGGKGLRIIHRTALLEAMAQELPSETIRFSSKVASIKTQTVESTLLPVVHLDDGTVIKAKVLIGCDGVHSVVAQWLGLGEPVHSGRSAVRGLSVYPEGHGFDHKIQQFIGHGVRAGFAPLNDTELYWFAVYNSNQVEEVARDPQLIKKQVMEKIAKGFPEIFFDVVRHSDITSLTSAPLMLRLPWELILRQLHKCKITVAGDAMHPMTPDLGQGGCSALEDAVVLARNIAKHLRSDGGSLDWGRAEEALEMYVMERRWRVTGIIIGAYVFGLAQQSKLGWFGKLLRDKIFYKFVYGWVMSIMHYDCGTLPVVP